VLGVTIYPFRQMPMQMNCVASLQNQLAPEFRASVSPMVPMKNFDEIAQSQTTPEERDPGL
jgi:hypothetical protein